MYCQKVGGEIKGGAVEWGGEVELRCLCNILGVDIHVYSADAPVLRMCPDGVGEAESRVEGGDGMVLRVSFHKHFYALGEHYNSVVPITRK